MFKSPLSSSGICFLKLYFHNKCNVMSMREKLKRKKFRLRKALAGMPTPVQHEKGKILE